MKKIDVTTLTSTDIKNEINRTKYNGKYMNLLKSTIYILIIIAAIGALLTIFVTPVLQISKDEMNYKQNDIVLSLKTKNIKEKDVIAFYYGNKVLLRRVIALPGSWVSINKNGEIYVDGNLLNEEYAKGILEDIGDTKYPYQVPVDSYFVLNDDRSDINDSRIEDIGAIKKENLIGKILFKVWPL